MERVKVMGFIGGTIKASEIEAKTAQKYYGVSVETLTEERIRQIVREELAARDERLKLDESKITDSFISSFRLNTSLTQRDIPEVKA